MRKQISAAVDVALVACALTLTGVTLFRRSQAAARATPQQVSNWQALQRSGHRVGLSTAQFVIAVWTDYECPACAREEQEFTRLRARLGDSLSIVYHQFPVQELHPQAYALAMLAECAALQDRFEVTHNLLFSRQPSHEVISAPETVEALGVADSAEFLRCVEAQGTRSTVDADVEGGRALGIRGTPTLLIRDRLQLGGLTAEELEVALRKAY